MTVKFSTTVNGEAKSGDVEANTLLSKAQHLGAGALAITESGIRIRAAIEKIREQAMNLE